VQNGNDYERFLRGVRNYVLTDDHKAQWQYGEIADDCGPDGGKSRASGLSAGYPRLADRRLPSCQSQFPDFVEVSGSFRVEDELAH
jgi:hypothetical protein